MYILRCRLSSPQRLRSTSCLEDAGFEFRDGGIEGGAFERFDERVAGAVGIDNGVDPDAGVCVTRIGLMLVGGAHRIEQLLLFRVAYLLLLTLELLDLDFDERPR